MCRSYRRCVCTALHYLIRPWEIKCVAAIIALRMYIQFVFIGSSNCSLVDRLHNRDDIEFVPEPEGAFSNRWLTTILTDSFEKREAIRLRLESLNIESRLLWKPMHLQPVCASSPRYVNGVSEGLFDRGLC